MARPIAIIGAGGFAREVLWLLQDCGVAGSVSAFYESDAHWRAREVAGIQVLPLSSLDGRTDAVIAVGDPNLRSELHASMPADVTYPTFVHPSARIGPRVEIGEGCVICAGCILTCDITLHAQVQLNLATTVGHDCYFEKYVTTAPAANISGKCRLGARTYIGTNACLRDGLSIPEGSVIGMGAVMVNSPTEVGIHVGNPARKR